MDCRYAIPDPLDKLRIATCVCLLGLLLESQMPVRPAPGLDALAGLFECLPAKLGPACTPVDNQLRASRFVVQLTRFFLETFPA
ncbi:hypothetical protein BAR24066_07367 [Burkholderia arboris]|uniref:Uncharacterized protein n=1 Tax=Burkholderia arboris TaxID=488730 RepID=A0A9Q9SRM6_9BURK|nr:hypothetical protein BAR24066_07367 [Burkholderia arboris]